MQWRQQLDSCTSAFFRPKAVKLHPEAACGSKAGYRGGCRALLLTECNASCRSVTAQMKLQSAPVNAEVTVIQQQIQQPSPPTSTKVLTSRWTDDFLFSKKGIIQNCHDGVMEVVLTLLLPDCSWFASQAGNMYVKVNNSSFPFKRLMKFPELIVIHSIHVWLYC